MNDLKSNWVRRAVVAENEARQLRRELAAEKEKRIFRRLCEDVGLKDLFPCISGRLPRGAK